MKIIRNLPLAGVAALLVAMLPLRGGAQSRPPAGFMMAQAAPGEPADRGGLSPSEITASVRSAGLDPRSRPLQRGGVYFLFAIDRKYMDVRVTVDATTGRVLSVTRLAGMRFGGPGYDGFEMLSRLPERAPAPPADIANRGTARSAGSASSSPPRAPPRAYPGEAVAASVAEASAKAEPRDATTPALGDTTAERSPPPPSTSLPAAPQRLPQPAMVPIAPLE
jgi:hypothetical protein